MWPSWLPDWLISGDDGWRDARLDDIQGPYESAENAVRRALGLDPVAQPPRNQPPDESMGPGEEILLGVAVIVVLAFMGSGGGSDDVGQLQFPEPERGDVFTEGASLLDQARATLRPVESDHAGWSGELRDAYAEQARVLSDCAIKIAAADQSMAAIVSRQDDQVSDVRGKLFALLGVVLSGWVPVKALDATGQRAASAALASGIALPVLSKVRGGVAGLIQHGRDNAHDVADLMDHYNDIAGGLVPEVSLTATAAV